MEHRSLTGDSLHEPKGVDSAASNRVYVSDGNGSGDWSLVDADSLSGTIGNNAEEGLVVVTDGQGGFSASVVAYSYGTLALTNNTAAINLTAASDNTLATNSDYQAITLNFAAENLRNIANGSNYFEIAQAGTYSVDFWCNVKSAVATSTIAFKYAINDSTFVSRRPKVTTNNAGRLVNVSANGITFLDAGDQIKLYIACSETAAVTIEDLAICLQLVEPNNV